MAALTPDTLASLTTLRVGGAARELFSPLTRAELVTTALEVWATGEDWFALGGGSNVVVADSGFDGSVIRILTRGIERLPSLVDGRVTLRVQAGEPWDDLVAFTVSEGLAGLEALSGIPGSCGAAPVQNIGAYGTELSASLTAIDFLDYESGEVHVLLANELGLGYRTSVIKRGRGGIVLSLNVELTDATGQSAPVAYEQLAGALSVPLGSRLPLAEVRASVMALRRSKGMVLDVSDADSVSVGSFFTNPIVSEKFARFLPWDAPRFAVEPDAGPGLGSDSVKLSAAWLIERAGIRRGFALPGSRAAVSGKHSLALTNRGGATASEIYQLARFIQERVRNEFGVTLSPEPMYLGVDLG